MDPLYPQTEVRQSSPAVPIAIICGFALIAIAIFFTNNNDTPPVPVIENNDGQQVAQASTISSVTEADYIRGNPNAPILMIEYSDYECPYCKQFHITMNQIMDEYGVTGKVAWVYRQFPLSQLHPNAPKISEAALCVGELGGNDSFWAFTDTVFEDRDFDSPVNVTRLLSYAESAGIDPQEYKACMDSGRNQEKVLASSEEAFSAGARSTPHTVLIVGNQQAVIEGAQSYNYVKGILQNLIDQIDGEPPEPETEDDLEIVTQ